jgi:hypothetical protein
VPDGSSTAHTYRPKLLTVLAEGYDAAAFRRDVMAALTVAVVALPLSMAIAVASGVTPARGLVTEAQSGRDPRPPTPRPPGSQEPHKLRHQQLENPERIDCSGLHFVARSILRSPQQIRQLGDVRRDAPRMEWRFEIRSSGLF